MKWTTTDPDGVLNSGTRWSIQFGTPRTIRVIHGLYVSDLRPSDRDDDLIIWTVEKHGVPEDRPYSGRRRSFSRWEPAKLPVFETGEKTGQVVTVDDLDQVVGLDQSNRAMYLDVTGQETER